MRWKIVRSHDFIKLFAWASGAVVAAAASSRTHTQTQIYSSRMQHCKKLATDAMDIKKNVFLMNINLNFVKCHLENIYSFFNDNFSRMEIYLTKWTHTQCSELAWRIEHHLERFSLCCFMWQHCTGCDWHLVGVLRALACERFSLCWIDKQRMRREDEKREWTQNAYTTLTLCINSHRSSFACAANLQVNKQTVATAAVAAAALATKSVASHKIRAEDNGGYRATGPTGPTGKLQWLRAHRLMKTNTQTENRPWLAHVHFKIQLQTMNDASANHHHGRRSVHHKCTSLATAAKSYLPSKARKRQLLVFYFYSLLLLLFIYPHPHTRKMREKTALCAFYAIFFSIYLVWTTSDFFFIRQRQIGGLWGVGKRDLCSVQQQESAPVTIIPTFFSFMNICFPFRVWDVPFHAPSRYVRL